MQKNQKARALLRQNKITFEGDNKFYELWFIQGRGDNYQVSYSKTKDTYNCTCKNIRLTSCYHIVAVQLYKKIQDARKK